MRRLLAAAATAALLTSGLALTQAPASAAPTAEARRYSNCDALARDFRHGVSKSRAAANKQVRDGYGRPAFGPRAKAVYRTNKSNLDRDKDGTACER